MAKQLVDDELWEVIKPLLPPPPKRTSTRGRPRLSDRAALTGILFVLRSGIPWEMLPQEMGCGSGMTCWRRLRDWHQAGVWRKLHQLLLSRLEQTGEIDWSRASIDSVSVRAKGAPRKKGAPSARPRRIAVNRARNAIRW
jgi:transposase